MPLEYRQRRHAACKCGQQSIGSTKPQDGKSTNTPPSSVPRARNSSTSSGTHIKEHHPTASAPPSAKPKPISQLKKTTMTTTEPLVSPTGRYCTKDTCALLGIGREMLRRYVKAGKISRKYFKANGRPYYTGASILTFWRQSIG